ncbi:NAD(+)/NADH kinase [Natrialba asiatica]|uniref:NAD kinase n=1 Tax=Natrialba asiatica (strain ATCC 700177 / DSM 12278 / JCM 9576 / FERM P-10747 / NBRC 102637 / 172P1) TaxID=29540 RepID=M0AJL5_NATA1|nr:NAD(+)/NADH kinase [Natrialba asiatica]ELY98910.1 ATP-NAD/AcoX kinase [Natrialba asiatica DSM 12278]
MADDADADATGDAAVGLVAQRANERARDLAVALQDRLAADETGGPSGDATVVDELTAEHLDQSGVPVGAMADCDLVVSIGGDGTLLYVAREVGNTPILGINLGEVGFLNAVSPDDALAVVPAVVEHLRSDDGRSTQQRELVRLQATGGRATEASTPGETPTAGRWTLDPALNEVVVHGPRRGHGGGATIDVRVDGRQYVEGHADGVLVSTPTGSSAYNLSEGGPLVHPTANSLVVTQMAAAAEESMPPLVVDAETEVTLSVTDAETAYVISDGRDRQQLDPPATVTVSVAPEPVTLVGPQVEFFEALEKLG